MTRPGHVPWKTVALPAEHGGGSFLAEPAILGLALAPSAAGACLALAALAGFLARHPLRLALIDRRKAEGKYTQFVDYAKLEAYRDFGGISAPTRRRVFPLRRRSRPHSPWSRPSPPRSPRRT